MDDLIVQRTAQQDASGWACQHALAVVSNLTVEAWACGYSIRDEGATIATEMVETPLGRRRPVSVSVAHADQRWVKFGGRFSVNAFMPSVWSSVAKAEWKSLRS